MKKLNFLIVGIFFPISVLMAQPLQLRNSKNDSVLEFSRTGLDGIVYNLSMSDSIATTNGLSIPHLTLFAGPPVGMHSTIALENTNLCCGHDSLTVVLGVLDNSGPLHHIIRITNSDFCLRSKEKDFTTGEYHISSAGISFDYQNQTSNSSWLLSNRAGKPGQVLMLNSTADTARWSSVNDFSNISYFNPADDAVINVLPGSNIIEPDSAIKVLRINLPSNPGNGTIIAFSFAKPVAEIIYDESNLASAVTTAPAGTTFKYIYYAGSNKWYNW